MRLKVIIKNSQVKSPSQNKVRVKLSGDGTNVGKHLHVINITFTILEEGSKAMSADGNHLVACDNQLESFGSSGCSSQSFF
jgi:hypothetical protein